MIQTKRSVTKEISVIASPSDLAAALLGDAFNKADRLEIHFADIQGNKGKVELRELMLVQFTRTELDDEPVPPAAMAKT